MGFGAAIWMVVLGVLGAANLIIARKPEAKELISKIAPYQGWMGAVSALWGVYLVIFSLSWLKYPLFGFTVLAEGILLFCLGMLLGVGVLKTFIKHPQAREKMDAIVAKLAPMQGTLGLVAIGLGAWGFVATILH